MDRCEREASAVHRACSRTARVTKRDPSLRKRQKEKEKGIKNPPTHTHTKRNQSGLYIGIYTTLSRNV